MNKHKLQLVVGGFVYYFVCIKCTKTYSVDKFKMRQQMIGRRIE